MDDGSSPLSGFDNEIVVTARLDRSQLILTEVEAQGISVDAVIDTGSEVTIGNSVLRDKLLKRHSRIIETAEITGVTGVTREIDFALIREVKLGSVTLRNVPIAFADLPPFEVFGIADKPSMLLGTDLMETFRKVLLDFSDRKVRFQLKDCDVKAVRIRTTGASASRIRANQSSACE